MRTRIAQEIKRDNIDTLIGNAIADACYKYMQHRFFFQETIDATTTTVQGTNLYTPPNDLITIDTLEITFTPQGLIIPLNKRSLSWIQARDVNIPPTQGQPTDYAYYSNQVRLYITPDAGPYTLTYYYKANIPPPVNDADAGFWMTTAEVMIRSFAKGLLYGSVLRNPTQAEFEFAISNNQFLELSGQNESLQFTGESKPTRF